ncbi:alcohol dehydrogenase [Penicillium sp. IBT 18751x]|nr:alcohol dehydrogenase [Penicillium sp. IBT 18751x]
MLALDDLVESRKERYLGTSAAFEQYRWNRIGGAAGLLSREEQREIPVLLRCRVAGLGILP